MPSFIIVGYLWQLLGRGGFFCPPPPISEQPRKDPSWIELKLKVRNTLFTVQITLVIWILWQKKWEIDICQLISIFQVIREGSSKRIDFEGEISAIILIIPLHLDLLTENYWLEDFSTNFTSIYIYIYLAAD